VPASSFLATELRTWPRLLLLLLLLLVVVVAVVVVLLPALPAVTGRRRHAGG
jgi:hypothetical protein